MLTIMLEHNQIMLEHNQIMLIMPKKGLKFPEKGLKFTKKFKILCSKYYAQIMLKLCSNYAQIMLIMLKLKILC